MPLRHICPLFLLTFSVSPPAVIEAARLARRLRQAEAQGRQVDIPQVPKEVVVAPPSADELGTLSITRPLQ